MLCSQCGLQMYEGSWNCPRCGNILSQQPYQNQGYAAQAIGGQATPLQTDSASAYNASPTMAQSMGVPGSAIESVGADPITPTPQSYYAPSTQQGGFPSAQNMMGSMQQPYGYSAQAAYGQLAQPYGQPDYMAGQGGYSGYGQAPYSMGGYPYAQPGALQTPTPRVVPGNTGRVFLSVEEKKAAEQGLDKKKKNKGLGWLIAFIVLLVMILALLIVFYFLSPPEIAFTPENIFTFYKNQAVDLYQRIVGMFS